MSSYASTLPSFTEASAFLKHCSCYPLILTLVHVDCPRLNLVDCSWRNLVAEPKNYILVAANVTCST